MSQLPKKINPDPILESIFEVRFITSLPSDALVGMIFGAVRTMLPQIVALPLAQMPEAIRSQDPNLQFQPTHLLQNGHLQLKIGPRVLTFSSFRRYDGWQSWSAFNDSVLERIAHLGAIERVERVGLRYVNFFQFPILDKLQFEISLISRPVDSYNTTCRFEIPDSGIMKVLQVSNNAMVQLDSGPVTGSLVDIDCLLTSAPSASFGLDSLHASAVRLHDKEKELFYSLLKPGFLATLKPEY